MRLPYLYTFFVEPLAHCLGSYAEMLSDLFAAPAVDVELGCFPRLFLGECGCCGVDATRAEMLADGDAVDAVVLG